MHLLLLSFLMQTTPIPLRSSHLHRSALHHPIRCFFSGNHNHMDDFQIRPLLNVIIKVLVALITCMLTFGGAIFGLITGSIKGQMSETGLVRGGGVGAVTGAMAVLQIMDMMANGEPFSKVAVLHNFLDGDVFTDWTNAIEVSMFDMENNGSVSKGLSQDIIDILPKHIFKSSSRRHQIDNKCTETRCVICLEDFGNKEEGRELPSCRHVFHVKCIDEWLIRQGSCPICRRDVYPSSEMIM